ncbi:MAG: nucleotidyl transferase AbiEii/AbiGii toxin family protein [Patescibacteria group bacterium]
MISHDTIIALATKLQTSETNVAREYCQHLFLRALYQQKNSASLCFKGGTAIRLVYKSPRFSEDLDFEHVEKTPYDFTKHDIATIEDVLTDTVIAIGRTNIAVDVKGAAPTSGGYLANIVFRLHGRPIDIRTEFSLRSSKKTRGDLVIITSEFFPNYSLIALPRDLIMSGKLTALLSRKKPRDFFDLYYMLRANLLPVSQRTVLPRALALIPHDPAFFTKELTEFLPSGFHALLKDFPRLLRQEVKSFI